MMRRDGERSGALRQRALFQKFERSLKIMGSVIGNIIGVVLVLAVIAIAVKILLFVVFGLFIGLFGVLLKLAIIGGIIYLAFVFLRKLFAEKQTI
jgi:hypothetical protein